MNKRILTVALVAPLFISGVALAKQDTPKEDKKVTICHATSAEKNPWVRIVVSENAIGGHFDNPGTPKAGHEDDVLLQGDVACPGTPVVDVCNNIEGNQATTPEGYDNKDGNCNRIVTQQPPVPTVTQPTQTNTPAAQTPAEVEVEIVGGK